ncbi:MAG: hypothetical protein ACPGJS_12610 [Flammeovirgaceae bacterium]
MKLRIWIPAILLIISSTYSIQHYYGVFNYYNQFTAKEDIKKGDIKLLLYGKINQDEKQGFTQFQNDFEVNIQRVTGEQVETSKLNGIKRYNKTVVNHLSKKHGNKFVKALPYRFR